ncbi:MAG: hypothetical protein ACMXYK_00940 [Candidatus Woesearchaeota archaeon]
MNNFTHLQKYISNLKTKLINAYGAFTVYSTLENLSNSETDKNASKNKEISTELLNNFFIPVENSLYSHSLIELAKLFDHAKKSIHIEKLINFAKSKPIRASDFKNYNQDRDFIEELLKEWEGINSTDIEEIQSLLKDNSIQIKKLITYRNKLLAHNNKKEPQLELSNSEIKTLFEIVDKILNIFSYKTNFSKTIFEWTLEPTIEQTEYVMKILRSHFEILRNN